MRVTIVCLLVLLHFCAGTTTYCDDYNNGGSCVLRRVCEPPRQYRSSRGLNGSDTVCSNCPNGRYTTKVNADECSLIPGINDFCPAGQGFTSGQCTSCSSGYYNTGNFKECQAHHSCPPGSRIMLQGTVYDDVVCEQCPYGQYRAAASTGQDCQPWKSCDNTEVLQVEGTATTDRVCEKASVRCPPGLFLNIDTMKCQRCSPGKYQQNFNTNPVTPSIGCPNVWEDCNRLRKPILRIGSYTQNNLCGEECEEGKEYFHQDSGSCVKFTECHYLREIESFAGNRTADRVCEQCPEIVTGLLGLERTYSLDGVLCNATDELICMMIRGFNCTYRRRVPLSYEEIMDNLDYLTYIAVAAVGSIVINTLLAVYIRCCKRRKKDHSKEKAEKEKYRLEKKEKKKAHHRLHRAHSKHEDLKGHHEKLHSHFKFLYKR